MMRSRRGRIGLWQTVTLVFLLALGGGGYAIAQLLEKLRAVQDTRTELEQRAAATQEHLRQVQAQLETVGKERDQLSTDRDNLLTQFKRITEEHTQVAQERTMLEEGFRQAETDRLKLEHRLAPLEAQHEVLAKEFSALQAERDRLQAALAKGQQRASGKSRDKVQSNDAALKAQLTKEASQRKQLRAELSRAKRAAQATAARQARYQAESSRTQKRLDLLEQKYAKLLSDNRSLRKQTNEMPLHVTGLAREHERLVKDLIDTHYNMGVLFAKRKDYVRAAKEFQRVVELRPDDPDAHFNLGVIYAEHLPNREKALAFFRQFLAVNPHGQDASYAKQYIGTWQAWEAKERLE